jgi:pimeloyl-ACP methyl ester carboxylesterase
MAIEASLMSPAADYIRVNGHNLQYLDWGGDGPPILILHATGFLGRVYRPIAQALRSLGHVFSYDQLGHGGSESPPLDEISWYRTADDLERFLEQMGLGATRAFGHSAGATAIAAIADRRPDLISRAMLVEPVIVDKSDPRERPSELYERTLKRKPAFDNLDAMYANFAVKPGYSTWRPDVLLDYCEYGSRPDADGRRILRCTPEVEARIYQTARDFDGLAHILATGVPMLLVFGGKSDSPGISFAEPIRLGGSHRQIVVIPDGGHLLPMEQPETIAHLAVDFFNGK